MTAASALSRRIRFGKRLDFVAGVAFATLACALSASAQVTSIQSGGTWNDIAGNRINAHGGGLHYENGTYYWFGEKRNRGASGGVNVYSSKDLYNWKFERLALALDSANPLIRPGCIMERPKVIRNPQTGKYVMWFHLELAGVGYDSAYAGIAESDSVTGPYRFVAGYRPNKNMARDQNVFVDDDGTPYHIYSSRDNYDLRLHTLTTDWLGASTQDSLIMYNQHREAPALFKANGKYYLITSGATGWSPNPAQLHVASSPWGPWVSKGNPAKGSGNATTFNSQSSAVFKLPGYPNAYLFMGDRWTPNGPDGVEGSSYVWLPLRVEGDSVWMTWNSDWTITGVFGQPASLANDAPRSRRAMMAKAGRSGWNPRFGGDGATRDLTGRRRELPGGGRPEATGVKAACAQGAACPGPR